MEARNLLADILDTAQSLIQCGQKLQACIIQPEKRTSTNPEKNAYFTADLTVNIIDHSTHRKKKESRKGLCLQDLRAPSNKRCRYFPCQYLYVSINILFWLSFHTYHVKQKRDGNMEICYATHSLLETQDKFDAIRQLQ